MADSRTRALSLAPAVDGVEGLEVEPWVRPGLADAVTLERRRSAEVATGTEEDLFLDTLAEYRWARDVAGLAASTLDHLLQPIIEFCDYYGLAPWRLGPRHLDKYFAGAGKRGQATIRRKCQLIDGYYVFLEQRYGGEIARRYGVGVESPVDPFNRPTHRGDFGLRVPPSRRATLEFFSNWRTALPAARKPAVANRDYVMAKIAYISGVRAAELCAVRMRDVHWEAGQWGRFLVHGKGARRSGERPREAYLFPEGRELLWWYIEEIRGMFPDDPTHPDAPLWPAERNTPAIIAHDAGAIAIPLSPNSFRRVLAEASAQHLRGPVTHLYPHLLRHACATHNYEHGMTLWEVQKLLGHSWTTTTVRYLATAHADPERRSLESSDRAAQRLLTNKGSLQ